MKKKIQTDGVEELFEIVRAIQNGEEPDEAVQKKRDERAAAARLEAQKQEEAAREAQKERAEKKRAESEALKERRTAGKKDGKAERTRSDDAFEELLNEDASAGPDFKKMMGNVRDGAGHLVGIFGRFRRKAEEPEEKSQESPATEAKETQKDLEAETDAKRMETKEQEADVKRMETKGQEAEADAKRVETKDKKTEADSKCTDSEEKTSDRFDTEKSEDEKTIDRILDRDDLSVSSPSEEAAEISPDHGETDAETLSGTKLSPKKIGSFFRNFRENLVQKEIRQKELLMIGAGFLLAVLCVLLIVNGVRSSLEQKKKMEHVTAEDGLTVTVEQEPEKWCSSYPVWLRVSVRGAEVTGVTVNGVSCQMDEQGVVTVDAQTYLLDVSVETKDGIKKAQVELPYLDELPPVVNAEQSDGMITLTAADARSSVKQICYAAVKRSDLSNVPQYRKYQEPFAFEKDTVYYFYAQDAAGNRSVPVMTTMETAQELTLADTELSLYPGETAGLKLAAAPEGALLNNLRFESSDENIVSVDQTGVVTGRKEGTASVRVSADGVADAACTITVSSMRSVTISAVGDCTLGTDESFNTTTNFQAFDAVNGHSWFFKNVKDILANDDATFANLEGTLTDETTREQKQYAFKGDPSYTEILKDGSIDVVTLANNHSSDYGAKSLTDTQEALEKADISYCNGDTIAIKEVDGVRTAFIGIYVLDDGMGREEQVKATIARAQEQGAKLIIVGFHWGSERATQPDDTQKALAHTAVDCGADLVVGHHPHVLQGIEQYNGVYIAYSLGNFCFGGNSAPSDMDTIIFRQTFQITEDGIQDGSTVEIIPCSVSSTQGYNNYQPTPAQGTEAERIIGRLNEYSQPFGQTFSAADGL